MEHADSLSVLKVRGLAVGYGSRPIQHDISFEVKKSSIFAIMGASGCGKSTLLKALIGLLRPSAGTVTYLDQDYWASNQHQRDDRRRKFGVVFQGGALWSAMTAFENVALPLQMFTPLDAAAIGAIVNLKLSLVGLETGRDSLPSNLSGGMRQRVGLARALAMDPQILFLDEPSAGLDPISSKRFDDLILELRDGYGVTVVMVSHELPSLFGICDDGIFLGVKTQTAIAHGAPRALRDHSTDPAVHAFMNREPIRGSTHE